MKISSIIIAVGFFFLIIISCKTGENNYSEIEFLEYGWHPYDIEGNTLALTIFQYGVIHNEEFQCFTYHCVNNELCFKKVRIDNRELSVFLNKAIEFQHDTLMDKGRNGNPFIKFIIHYQDEVQTISVVRDRLEADNTFVQFYKHLDSCIRNETKYSSSNKSLVFKRNKLIKSMCKNPFNDVFLYPDIMNKNVSFKVDTTSH